jgi:hypothetical protein
MAAENANSNLPFLGFKPMVMSILLAQQKRIRELEKM